MWLYYLCRSKFGRPHCWLIIFPSLFNFLLVKATNIVGFQIISFPYLSHVILILLKSLTLKINHLITYFYWIHLKVHFLIYIYSCSNQPAWSSDYLDPRHKLKNVYYTLILKHVSSTKWVSLACFIFVFLTMMSCFRCIHR